jgi:hypothetical protein
VAIPCTVVEKYKVAESIVSVIVREFCVVIEKNLKPLVIEKQNASTLQRFFFNLRP